VRIAIIGFGFSGLMVVANLVRAARAPLTLYIIDEKADGLGTAYGTTNPRHLLNVPAGNMGAFADNVGGLCAWLESADAAQHKAQLGITRSYDASDFIPRVLYGAYLASIWREAQEMAAHKKIDIKLVLSRAVAVQAGSEPAVLTTRGDAIAVDRIILAAGHEAKVILPQFKSPHIIQNPWADGVLDGASNWVSPVMVMGTGLTAIDMMLSLRACGYAGEILLASRNGLLPQTHAAPSSIFSFTACEITALRTLPAMLRLVRRKIRERGDWRAVVDALRPHTQTLWQRLSTYEQQRALRWLMPSWNIHRHRMASEIAAVVDAEIAAGKLRIIRSKNVDIKLDGAQLSIRKANGALQPVSRILNATGLELNLARSSNTLLKQMLADGMVEAHITGFGVVADKHYRAWGLLYPNLFVMGSLLTGQLLESTAVPELREQAAAITKAVSVHV
jgi:uncharacterized NAD(P)/FAD-binding protein YdhS